MIHPINFLYNFPTQHRFPFHENLNIMRFAANLNEVNAEHVRSNTTINGTGGKSLWINVRRAFEGIRCKNFIKTSDKGSRKIYLQMNNGNMLYVSSFLSLYRKRRGGLTTPRADKKVLWKELEGGTNKAIYLSGNNRWSNLLDGKRFRS